MRRGWFILLALSLGLNAGILVTVISGTGRALGGQLRKHFTGEQGRGRAADPRYLQCLFIF
jgi:hypothetical protein